MSHDLKKIREVLSVGYFPSIVPLTVVREAIDELEGARVQVATLTDTNATLLVRIAELEAATSPVPGLAGSGPYTLADVDAIEAHRGKPYTRLRETVLALNSCPELVAARLAISGGLGVAEGELPKVIMSQLGHFKDARDAAKADAARLREALEIAERSIDDSEIEGRAALNTIRAALSATDSAEWLAKHDAEVRKEARTGLLAAKFTAMDAQVANDGLRAQVETLTQQLVAATNDAARAELRARDLVEALRVFAADEPHRVNAELFAASPDSDARLREVMRKVDGLARTAGWAERENKDRANWADDALPVQTPDDVIDEALRGGK